MPIKKNNTNGFFKRVYAGETETATLLKRDDDQRAGVVRSVPLYGVRWDQVHKAGQHIHQGMTTDHRREIHIPREELDYAGVNYINGLDRFVDEQNRHWHAESPNLISNLLFENVVVIRCVRVDPPNTDSQDA